MAGSTCDSMFIVINVIMQYDYVDKFSKNRGELRGLGVEKSETPGT